MKRFLSKPYRWAGLFSVLLTAAFTFVLMDTFVIEKSYSGASASQANPTAAAVSASSSSSTEQGSSAAVTDSSYDDGNIKITIETERYCGSTVYIADIQVADPSCLKTAFANGTYGRNIKQTTSDMAEANDAIFAINGDYYGFRNYGYVLRNGVAYRDTAGSGDALVIDENGDFSIISESGTSLAALDSAWQVLSFGPALIEDGEIVVDSSSEVSQSMTSNPRTAIGQVSELHYIVVVSDGRTSESEGLSLLELAQVFEDRGCTVAYNLDGGGSSTMYFNGQIINNPTDGSGTGERKVSDIVYFGY
ncbi:MAG: putative Exopolysaccharide biosynthesis protein [Firmicutes bacterium]|nr:putative Exopolysaccharide biosynthesis protein [Bacillota bacterium]